MTRTPHRAGRPPTANAARKRRDIAVLGTSAGGVTALRTLFAALPSPSPVTVIAVIHRSPFHESLLPMVLGARSPHRVSEPEQDERVERRFHGSAGPVLPLTPSAGGA